MPSHPAVPETISLSLAAVLSGLSQLAFKKSLFPIVRVPIVGDGSTGRSIGQRLVSTDLLEREIGPITCERFLEADRRLDKLRCAALGRHRRQKSRFAAEA